MSWGQAQTTYSVAYFIVVGTYRACDVRTQAENYKTETSPIKTFRKACCQLTEKCLSMRHVARLFYLRCLLSDLPALQSLSWGPRRQVGHIATSHRLESSSSAMMMETSGARKSSKKSRMNTAGSVGDLKLLTCLQLD